ncbi:unconventional myosin-XVIIIa-like [Drosophila teissieri]|uniref:unconventional myosin-XVIIIa-like n=1 Tax=Drosophila teissieri TaxID=7243 RepID=UPI001CBA3CE5|nr:unconventional myosin-XVIIIa-like [Drosophila teissieri]
MKNVTVNNVAVECLVDTGAVSILRKYIFNKIPNVTLERCASKLHGLGRKITCTVGYFLAEVAVDKEMTRHKFVVLEDEDIEYDALLGFDFFAKEVSLLINNYKAVDSVAEVPVRLRIVLDGEIIPFRQSPSRFAIAEENDVEKQINEWLDAGIIRPSTSNFASRLVLLSELTVDLAEERSTAHIATERLEAETAERLKLEKEQGDQANKVKNLQETTEKLEMELICAKSDLNGISEDEDAENEDGVGGGVYKLKYERVARELEFTKRRLHTQDEHDLEQLVGLKKQLEKKLSDAYEEVEEQRQVVGQWKRKAQKMTNEMNDLRMLLEEQERQAKEQEEELDEMAGQIQLLEQAKLRLEMTLETMRKEARRESQQRDEELEEVRGNGYKKIKALECQLETEHEERTLLLREKHELERRLSSMEDRDRVDRDADEALNQKLRRDLHKYKALLKDAQTQLERLKADTPGKTLIRQLRNQLEDAESARSLAMKARQTAEAELTEVQAMFEELHRARNDAEERANAVHRDWAELQAQIEENEEELGELMKKYSATVKQLRRDGIEIQRAQESYKRNFDLKRKPEVAYKVGDLVAIRQTQFVAGKKLAGEYMGPYEVSTVKRNGRYEVRKAADFEGPCKTSTSCDYMKLWRYVQDNEDDWSSGTDE